jgi:hypothetical protein
VATGFGLVVAATGFGFAVVVVGFVGAAFVAAGAGTAGVTEVDASEMGWTAVPTYGETSSGLPFSA